MTNETELLQAVKQLAAKDVAPFDLQIDRQAKLPNGLFRGAKRPVWPRETAAFGTPNGTTPNPLGIKPLERLCRTMKNNDTS